MRPWIPFLALTIAGLAIVAWLASPDDHDGTPARLPAPVPTKDEPRCPRPRVTKLTARPGSENGYRIGLHVRAEADRGLIGGFLLRWGDGSHGGVMLLVKAGGRRLSFPLGSHHYRKDGTYRISLVAEAESPSCGRMKSEPATLRVRIPLR